MLLMDGNFNPFAILHKHSLPQTFLGLSRVPPHERRSWGGTRDKPKNVCVGGYRDTLLMGIIYQLRYGALRFSLTQASLLQFFFFLFFSHTKELLII